MRSILCLLALLCAGTASALPPPATPPTVPATAAPAPTAKPLNPAQRLRLGVQSLMAFMNQEPRPAPSAIARFLDTEIAPLFDFDAMARAAAGRFYLTLSPQQRSAMAEEIKRLFLTRLTQGLTLYRGQQVRFLPARFSPDGSEAVIGMAILNPDRYPARIDFRLAREPGKGWRIIDIAANGSSAVVYYRQMLAHEMARRAWARRPPPPPPGFNRESPPY
jgi:phospholipid transport system substrate-binding protein